MMKGNENAIYMWMTLLCGLVCMERFGLDSPIRIIRRSCLTIGLFWFSNIIRLIIRLLLKGCLVSFKECGVRVFITSFFGKCYFG